MKAPLRNKRITKLIAKTALVWGFLFNAFFFCTTSNTFGQTVSSDKALTIAKNFYYSEISQVNTLKSAKTSSFIIAKTENIAEKSGLKSGKNIPVFYVINIGENDGFILVAGDERLKPILGYSLVGNYDEKEIPEHISSFFNGYKEEISEIIENPESKNLPSDKKWGELEFGNTKSGIIKNNFNLITSNWGQGKNYNAMCPEDPAMVSAAYNGHVPAGCVAVVMSQIMRYWSWPLTGNGKICYTPTGHSEYGEQCADFASSTYDYSGMVNQISETNNNVAKLIYHAAVSVNMNFSPAGSTTYSTTTVQAFVNNFNFSEKADFVYRSSYSDAEWVSLLKKHLDNGVPLYYRGDNEGKSSHAFICDGYDQEGRFHFNWGWDGRYNGFYSLSTMSPLINSTYKSNQGAIINLFPSNNDFAVERLTSANSNIGNTNQIVFSYNQIYNGADFNDMGVVFSYWLSKDSIKNDGDILLEQEVTNLSSENNQIEKTKSIQLPDNLGIGEYYILVEAKSIDNVKETNLLNNIGYLKIKCGDLNNELNKSTFFCSDLLEPNNSVNEAFYINSEVSYSNNGLCLSDGDDDWFEFKMNSKTYFAKISLGKNSSYGYYGIRFDFRGEGVEITTFETQGNTDTKIYLYDENLSLIAEDDNNGENQFARLIFRPSYSTTSASIFNETNFKVYPNPAKEKINISSGIRFDKDVIITLMDIRGTLLEKKSIGYVTQSSEYTFDLSRYADGQYIVGIYSADGAFVSKKIIKKSWT